MENKTNLTKDLLREMGWEKENDNHYYKTIKVEYKDFSSEIVYRFLPNHTMLISSRTNAQEQWQTVYKGLFLNLEDFRLLQNWLCITDIKLN